FGAPAALLSSGLLPLCFRWRRGRWRRRAALHADLHRARDLRMQTQLHVMLTEGPNRVVEMNLLLVERDFELGLELVRNHSRGHRPKHFSVVTGLDGDQANEFRDALV